MLRKRNFYSAEFRNFTTVANGIKQGARVSPLCTALGIHTRTYARWKADPIDRRKSGQ